MGKEGFLGSLKKKKISEIISDCGESSVGTPTKRSVTSSSSTPSRRATPKKLLARLFCSTPKLPKHKGSSSSAAGAAITSQTSSEDYRGYPLVGFSQSYSTSSKSPPQAGLALSESAESSATALTIPSVPSIADSEATETARSTSISCVLQSPPRVTRSLISIETTDNSRNMKSHDPTSIPLPESPVRTSKRMATMTQILDTTSPDPMDDMFLPESSSSYSEGSPMNNLAEPHHPSPTAATTPTNHNSHHHAMKTPGMAISSPAHSRALQQTKEEDNTKQVLFQSLTPLRSISESPRVEVTHVHLSHSVSEAEEEDDEAFLPDDFKKAVKTFTWEDVQKHVREAEDQLREHLEDQHEHAMEEFQEEAEKALQEHGGQWKAESELEYQHMDSLLKEERRKTEQKHLDLIHKVTSMSEMKNQINENEHEKQAYLSQIASLEAQLQDAALHEIASLEAQLHDTALNENDTAKELYKDQLDQQIQSMQEQLVSLRRQEEQKAPENNGLDQLKSQHEQELQEIQKGKSQADQQVVALQEQLELLQQQKADSTNGEGIERGHQVELRLLKASYEAANQLVLELEDQLFDLRQQVDSSNMEELIIVKSGMAAAERKISDLQEQLDTRNEKHLHVQAHLREAHAEVASLKQQVEELEMEKSLISDLQEQLDTRNEKHLHVQAHLREAHAEVAALKQQVEELEMEKSLDNMLDVSHISEISHEEFFAARAEVETLRVLRQEEEKEKDEQLLVVRAERDKLRAQLHKVEHQFQLELNSPRKKGRDFQITALKIEVEPSTPTRNSATNTEDENEGINERLKIMGQNFERLQEERDSLASQLLQTQERQAEEREAAVQQTREELESKIKSLQEHMDQRQQSFSAELSAAEYDELTAEVEDMKKRHQEELKTQMKSAITDLENFLEAEEERVGKLRTHFEQQEAKLEESHRKEVKSLQSQMKELEAKHEGEIELVKVKSKEEREHEMNRWRVEFENEKIEIIETSAKEHDELQAQLSTLSEQHKEEFDAVRLEAREEVEKELKLLQAELEMTHNKYEKEKFKVLESSGKECDALRVQLAEMRQLVDRKVREAKEQARADSDKEIKGLTEQIQSLEADAESRPATSVTEAYINEMQAKFEEDLDDVKTKANSDLDALQETLNSMTNEKKDASTRVQSLESQVRVMERKHKGEVESAKDEAKKEMEAEFRVLEETVKAMEMGDNELTKRVAELQAKTVADRKEYSHRVREVRAEHGKEIEELLSQLDLVEAEHNERYKQKEKYMKEKDTVISALGSQLADAQSRLGAHHESQESLAKELEALRENLDMARAEIEARNQDIVRLVAEHQRGIDAEMILREEAIELAREEMIERAEVQFQQANATYKKLKHEFDSATSKIATLERDVRFAKKEAAEMKKRQEGREVDLADELAQAKSAIATSDLNAARKVKQYRAEVEKSKEAEYEMRQKLSEAMSTSRSVQSTLAAVVAEKEKLIDENREMKAVCEELMAMVEGNQEG